MEIEVVTKIICASVAEIIETHTHTAAQHTLRWLVLGALTDEISIYHSLRWIPCNLCTTYTNTNTNTRNKQRRDKATTVSILCIGACEHCKMYGTINHKVHKHIDRARVINSHELCASGGPEPRQKWKLVFCHCHSHIYTRT